MKKSIISVLAATAAATAIAGGPLPKIEDLDRYMTIKEPDESGFVWYKPDVSEDSPFKLIGFYWYGEDHIFNRLPQKSGIEFPKGVKVLAQHTAGGQVRFRTNSKRVAVRAETTGFGAMNHMAQTGSGGFDLYAGKDTDQIFLKTTTYPLNETKFTSILFTEGDGETMYDFTLNFPLYNGVKSLEIGVDAGAEFETPLPFVDDRPIVIYGTSVTQGGCASRPRSLFTNILSRRLNRPFINLGFSGNGCGEPEMAHLINLIDNPALIIIDYEGNADEAMDKTLTPFMEILRNHDPDVPILIMTRIRSAFEAWGHSNTMADPRAERMQIRYQHQKNEYDKWVARGDKNIYFLDGGTLLGDDYADCTVDGIHPTDMGFFRMADNMEPVLRDILAKYPVEKQQ